MLSCLFSLFLLQTPTPPVPPPPAPAAGPTVSIPKTITGAAGDLIPVTAESGAELITWDSTPGLSIVTHVNGAPDPAQKSVNIHASKDGEYALTASIPNGKGTRVSICLVTIGPRPPPPLPPVLTFQDKLQAAFEADKANSDATLDQTSKLAALYRVAATTTVQDATLKTTADLLAEMQRAAKNLGIPPGSLDRTARVISDELNKTFSTNSPLTPALRTQIAQAFTAVNVALEKLH